MTGWLSDLRIALRLLRRRPGWTAAVLTTLALAIGANSALFSVLDAALLQPLPYPAPERLVLVGETAPSFEHMSVSYPDYQDWRNRTRSFDALGAYRAAEVNLTGVGPPRRARAVQASASYFGVLRVSPLVGRTFEEEEDRPGGPPVTVLDEDLARRLFGSPAEALGRSLQVDGRPSTVVGVLPRSFRVEGRPELWVPVGQFMVSHTADRGNHPGLTAVGRLKPGVGFGEARAELDAVGRALQEEYPQNRGVLPLASPMHQLITQDVRGSLWLLMGAVVLVLLIAAANVGSLLLARGTGRLRELAIRGALGAGRVRLVRQLLVESLLLAVLGGALGLLVAAVAMQVLTAHRPSSLPDHVALSLNLRVLGFTLGASVGCALLFGLVPALIGSRTATPRGDASGGGPDVGGAAPAPRGARRGRGRAGPHPGGCRGAHLAGTRRPPPGRHRASTAAGW